MKTKLVYLTFKSIDLHSLNRWIALVLEESANFNVNLKGPIPLPRKIQKWTVLRSPHIDKKSREQFEIRTYHRLFVLEENSQNSSNWICFLESNIPTMIQFKKQIQFKNN